MDIELNNMDIELTNGIDIKPFKTVTGFVYHQNVQQVLSVYMKRAGVTAPIFIQVEKEFGTGRWGYYVGLFGQFYEDDIERLRSLLQDIEVSDKLWGTEK